MIESADTEIKTLDSILGHVQSVADLFSFPGTEYLNINRFEEDIDKVSGSTENIELTNHLKTLREMFIENDQQKLMVEYARLFVGPYHVVAPPYGSYYLENGRLMGDSTIEVSKFYSSGGLAINDSFKDLPDHIIAELEFIIFLIHNEIQFLEKSEPDNYQIINNLKREFFNKYFYSWIRDFSAIILEQSDTEFYREIANYLNKVVAVVYQEINKTRIN